MPSRKTDGNPMLIYPLQVDYRPKSKNTTLFETKLCKYLYTNSVFQLSQFIYFILPKTDKVIYFGRQLTLYVYFPCQEHFKTLLPFFMQNKPFLNRVTIILICVQDQSHNVMHVTIDHLRGVIYLLVLLNHNIYLLVLIVIQSTCKTVLERFLFEQNLFRSPFIS